MELLSHSICAIGRFEFLVLTTVIQSELNLNRDR